MKLMTRAFLIVCVPIASAGVLQAEPSWPGLTPDLWEDMTPKEIERLLSEGNDISQRDGVGMTALMRAAQYNRDPNVLRLLVDRGAQVDVRDQGGWTPLMRAARSNPNPEIHGFLIAAGADVNGRNMANYTALIWATRENPNPDVVLLLLDAGANPTIRGVDGRRAADFIDDNPAITGTLAEERLRGR
jgi:ankyrin repeat protein